MPNSFQQNQYRPPTQQYQPPPPPPKESAFQEQVLNMLQNMQADNQSNKQLLHSHTQSISKLESQMGQLAQSVGRRDEGKLPSQPVNNLRGKYGVESSNANNHFQEQAKAITTLRSGKEVDNKVEYQKDDEFVRFPDKGKAPAVNLV